MNGRRAFVRAAAAALLVSPFTATGAPEVRIRRVGWLNLGQAWSLRQFRDKLKELGWIEGRNVVIDARFADNDASRLPALAAELLELKVDVIVTQSTPAAVAAKNATATVPIVMAGSSSNLEGLDLVASLARPGGNVTGMTNNPGTGFGAKVVQMLKEAAPRVTRLAVLDRSGAGAGVWEDIENIAPDLGIKVIRSLANTHYDVPGALTAALRHRADGLYVPANPVNVAAEKMLVEFALRHRLPAIAGAKELVSAGLLMSYFADWGAIRQQAAVYVDKILRGANPGELPVERPTKFELAINLSTARTLGLVLPRALMLRADALFADGAT